MTEEALMKLVGDELQRQTGEVYTLPDDRDRVVIDGNFAINLRELARAILAATQRTI